MADFHEDAPPVSKLCNQLGLPDPQNTLGNGAKAHRANSDKRFPSASSREDGPALLREYEEAC